MADSKLIAKNTLALYGRMLVMLVIGLYTSRVILNVLGVDNYAIYNVVGSILGIFSILTSSMSGAISRFITVGLGKGILSQSRNIFSTSLIVQFLMGLLLVVLIETGGLWFLNNKMTLPASSYGAALFCLHCTTISTFISLLSIPLNASIMAHERMAVFAYISLGEAVLKLLICYLLYVSPFGKLQTYSVLLLVVSCLTTLTYWLYCRSRFEECRFELKFDKTIFRQIWGFAGWNIVGHSSWILNTQGVNMLMNVFFGLVVNAARGISVQVSNIVNQFVNNFMMALNPQITMSYVSGNKGEAYVLACRGAKFSFYIMFLISLPLMLEANLILHLWLGLVPEYTSQFLIWTILACFPNVLGNTLTTLQMAHGNIGKYQTVITIYTAIVFPLTWILYKLKFTVITGYYIYFIIYMGLIYVRFRLVNKSTGIPGKMYLIGVVLRCFAVALCSSVIPVILTLCMTDGILRLLILTTASIICCCACFYFLGMDRAEREFVMNFVQKKLYNKTTVAK